MGIPVTPPEDTNNNKLGIVNMVLSASGFEELPEGTNPNTMAAGTIWAEASQKVDEVYWEVLNRGWFFNMDYDFMLYPDNDGFIILPNTVLRMDATRWSGYQVRGHKVYDMRHHTFIFDSPIKVDLVWLVSYSDLSVAAHMYIGARAAAKFYKAKVGAPAELNALLSDEVDALINLQRENAQSLDQSLLNTQVSLRYTNPYTGL